MRHEDFIRDVNRRAVKVAQEDGDQYWYDDKSDEIYGIIMNYKSLLLEAFRHVAFEMLDPLYRVLGDTTEKYEGMLSADLNRVWENISRDLEAEGFEITPEVEVATNNMVKEYLDKVRSEIMKLVNAIDDEDLYSYWPSEWAGDLTRALMGEPPGYR